MPSHTCLAMTSLRDRLCLRAQAQAFCSGRLPLHAPPSRLRCVQCAAAEVRLSQPASVKPSNLRALNHCPDRQQRNSVICK